MESFYWGLLQRLVVMWWVNSHLDINNGMSQRQTVNKQKTHRQVQASLSQSPHSGLSTHPQKLHCLCLQDVAKGVRLDAKCLPIQRFVFLNMGGRVPKRYLWLSFSCETASNDCFVLCFSVFYEFPALISLFEKNAKIYYGKQFSNW